MSVMKRQPIRLLLKFSQVLKGIGFNYNDPFDDEYESINKISNITSWIGEKMNMDDAEFMAAFMKENEELIEQLENKEISIQEASEIATVPELKKFKMFYEIWGPATLTEKYSTTWESYFESWAKKSLRYSYNEGEFDYFQGDYDSHETDNYEPDNFDITYVQSLDETKKPILDKLVVENTKELIDNLDRDTLIQLRNLIIQKLSS